VLASLAISVAGGMWWLWRWEVIDPAAIKLLVERSTASFWLALAIIACGVGAAVAVQRQMRSTVLILDSEGIRMEMKAPWPVAMLALNQRRIAWAELAHVSHLPRFGIVQLLKKEKLALPWPIRLHDWRPDLLPVLDRLGVLAEYPKATSAAAMEFDLAANPATRRVLVCFVGLALYSVVDNMLQDEAWAFFNMAYCLPHAIVGAAAAVALGLWLKHAEVARDVPQQSVAGLAVLAALIFGTASYIGGVRINQAFGGPLIEAEYHRNAACNALDPVDKDLPVVEYTDLAKGYWCSIPITRAVKVPVRQGLFGLYQVRLAEQTQAIRAYRESR